MIDELPPPALRSDPPDQFNAKEDAWRAAMPTFGAQVNAAALAMNLNSTTDTSSSSVAIGLGAKTFAVSAGKSFLGGMWLEIADAAAPSTNSMFGQVTSYAGTSLVMNITTVLGSGTKASWLISQSAPGGAALGDLQLQAPTAYTTGGSATAYTLTPAPALAANTTNARFRVAFHAAAGATPTLAVSGLVAKNLKYKDAAGAKQAVTAAQIPSGWIADVEYDGTDWVVLNIPPRAQLQPISASIAANAITIVPGAMSLDFRHATLTNGAVTTVSGTPANLVIAATDSFGLVTAAGNQRLAILAINNAGTIELAAASLAGGVSLDETGVITTATAATAGTHIKAANVRAGVAYRVIGYLDATFTTATGWGSLALVQGAGGNAAQAMSGLGYGQTWQSVTRNASTTYYNTTGKPIVFMTTIATSNNLTMTIRGVTLPAVSTASVGNGLFMIVIPPGASYSYTGATAGAGVFELR